MALSIMYIFLSILALSFLIFIHEFGHYWMARRTGMKVDTFSIGFGKPIYSWTHNGVKWQIGWLLCGGYVKIAGMDLEKGQDPYEVPNGFFKKRPWDRIKVLLMGPLTNLLFALLAFTGLWVFGGREKNYSEFTSKIGWVDPHSDLYALGIRPGDEITAYNDLPYQGIRDLLYSHMIAEEQMNVSGFKVNYASGEKHPFEYSVKTYQHPHIADKGFRTTGILSPASYVIYNRFGDGSENQILEGSPMATSGIQYGDRIVWMDGELIFFVAQLGQLLNSHRILLTIKRDNQILLARVPRILVNELRPDPAFREELVDWQYEARLNNVKIQNLYTIPYNITDDGVVENRLQFIDKEDAALAFPDNIYSRLEEPLQPGDHILAVNGTPIEKAYQLLKMLQTYQVNIIVQRNPEISPNESWTDADHAFDQEIHWPDLQAITQSIGIDPLITQRNGFYLLNAVTPKSRRELTLAPDKQVLLDAELLAERKNAEAIEDPEMRAIALKHLDQREKNPVLGLILQDRHVSYNPSPIDLFNSSFQEIQRTLTSVISGALNPKWLAGPVGIIQIVQSSSMQGLREALYWLGLISLNLGILNLLPIPMLDGGTIVITLVEMVTGKRMHPKTLEKLIIPFAILLIGFFLFITYHDLIRLFGKFWK